MVSLSILWGSMRRQHLNGPEEAFHETSWTSQPPELWGINVISITQARAAWVLQLVKCSTLDFGSGHDLVIVRWSPFLVGLHAGSGACLGFSPNVLPQCCLSLSLLLVYLCSVISPCNDSLYQHWHCCLLSVRAFISGKIYGTSV